MCGESRWKVFADTYFNIIKLHELTPGELFTGWHTNNELFLLFLLNVLQTKNYISLAASF